MEPSGWNMPSSKAECCLVGLKTIKGNQTVRPRERIRLERRLIFGKGLFFMVD
jgi:hypothetical protein